MIHNERLDDVGMAIREALVLKRQKLDPETKQYMFGLWSRAAEQNLHNKMLHREMVRKAEQFSV